MRTPALILVFIALIIFPSCKPEAKKMMFTGETQGTYYAITYFDARGRDFQPVVDSLLRAFDLSVSMWVPESVISRINKGDPTALPDEWFKDIYLKALTVSEKTGGSFDFTIGPLVNAWGFGFKNKILLDSAKVDSLKGLVDYRTVRLEEGRIVKEKPDIQFDFNAIAQGYAVDLLGEFLQNRGIEDFLVDIGGEVLGKGAKPDGSAWIVGIENPAADSLSERSINTMVRLSNMAVSTSGSYRKYRIENGQRYSHTIDPFTGYPVKHNLLSVTVLADNCAIADAYATSFMVMGFEKAKDFIARNPGLEAFFIVATGEETYDTYATEGFEKIIVKEK
jgi:thiamine biosynthesis lipoprotein